MSHFSSSAKQYAAANSLVGFGSISVNVAVAGTTLDQTAPPFLLGPDNQQLAFLFWDTGRRITNKRTVRWTFNHPENWTDWHAVAWYGVVGPDGTPQPLVGTGAYWIGQSTMTPTPIDGPGSSFVNGPGAANVAWPWQGDDHVARTQWGAATLHAVAQMQRSSSEPLVHFSSWVQLIYGGDDSGFFAENDDTVSGLSSGSGVSGLENAGSGDFTVAQGGGATLLAGYVTPPPPDHSGLLGRLREVLAGGLLGKYIDKGDPSPEDVIRLKLISETLDMVRGQRPTSSDAFEGLLEAAPKMSAQELKRTIVSTQTTLKRGQAAVKFLESLAAKAPAAKQTRTKKPAK